MNRDLAYDDNVNEQLKVAPQRRRGVILTVSPVLAIDQPGSLSSLALSNEAPTHRATFSGTTNQPALSESVRRACEFSTFRAGSGTKIVISSATLPSPLKSSAAYDDDNKDYHNHQHPTSSNSSFWSTEDEPFRPYFCSRHHLQSTPSFRSSFNSLELMQRAAMADPNYPQQQQQQHHSHLKLSDTVQPDGQLHTISLNTVGYSAPAHRDKQAAACNTKPNGLSVVATTTTINKLDHNKLAPPSLQDDNVSMSSRGSRWSRRATKIENPKPPFPMAGFLGAVFASICFSLSMLCLKLIPDGGTLQERTKQMFVRGLLLMLFTSMTIIYNKSTFRIERNEIMVNFLRSFFGSISSYGAYAALNFISIGESQAIIFSCPIWTSILGYFVMGETFSWTLVLGLPFSILGIILIAHPDLIADISMSVLDEIHRHHHENQYAHLHPRQNHTIQLSAIDWNDTATNGSHWLLINNTLISIDTDLEEDVEDLAANFFKVRLPGILISILTSILLAIVYIVLKFRKSTPIQTTTFYLGLGNVVITFCVSCAIGFGRWPDTEREWLLLLAIGLLSWVAQASFQWSCTYEDASMLSVIRATDVVLSFVFGVLFLDEDLLWTSVLGAALILGVVMVMMLRNYFENKRRINKLTQEAKSCQSKNNNKYPAPTPNKRRKNP